MRCGPSPGRRPQLREARRICDSAKSARRAFFESISVEVLNPKTALFFLAFLPQFVDLTRGPPAPQILLLGAIVTLSAIPCDLAVAVLSGSAARKLSRSSRLARIQEYISGSILIALGLYVARAERAI